MARSVLILGAQRSGTNMLLRAIAKSRDITHYNENNPKFYEKDSSLKSIDVLNQAAANTATPIAVFKPIVNIDQTVLFQEQIANVRILFIFRAYSAVVRSYLKMFEKGGMITANTQIEAMINKSHRFWRLHSPEVCESIRESLVDFYDPSLNRESIVCLWWMLRNLFFITPGFMERENVINICYDELTLSPETHFRNIASFIGITYENRFAKGIAPSKRWDYELDIEPRIESKAREIYNSMLKLLAANKNAR